MKGLTINRLALSGLRANRKDYRQMAVGIFLAVFLAVGTALGLWGISALVSLTTRRSLFYSVPFSPAVCPRRQKKWL